MSMASRLRSAREAKGLDIPQVAERLGLSEAAARHHENGTRNPKTKTIAQYSRLYGVTVDWIMRGVGSGPAPSEVAEFIELWEDTPTEERPMVLDIMRAAIRRANKMKGHRD